MKVFHRYRATLHERQPSYQPKHWWSLTKGIIERVHTVWKPSYMRVGPLKRWSFMMGSTTVPSDLPFRPPLLGSHLVCVATRGTSPCNNYDLTSIQWSPASNGPLSSLKWLFNTGLVVQLSMLQVTRHGIKARKHWITAIISLDGTGVDVSHGLWPCGYIASSRHQHAFFQKSFVHRECFSLLRTQ